MPREIKGPSPSSRRSPRYPGMKGGGSFLSFLPRRGVASDADARNRSTMINFQSQLNYAGRLSPIEEASPDGERTGLCSAKKKRKKGDHVKIDRKRKREKAREIASWSPHRIKGSSFSLEEDCVQGWGYADGGGWKGWRLEDAGAARIDEQDTIARNTWLDGPPSTRFSRLDTPSRWET